MPRSSAPSRRRVAETGSVTAVPGVRVGHSATEDASSGVSVLVFDRASPTVVDVRGGASCTYDTASLDLEATFGRRWALFFSGGSVFGLDAARGIRTFLVNAGAGHPAFKNPNPIVPISGACLFDLPARPGAIPDYLPLGFEAARSANSSEGVYGRVGAGAGAHVGKYRGRASAMPGGLASAARQLRDGHWIGVLVVVNSVGAIRDESNGEWVAGALGPSGRVIPPTEPWSIAEGSPALRGTNLAAIVTDAPVDRRALHRVAVAGHAGIARSVVPAQTSTDGDTVFAVATRERRAPAREAYPGAQADELGLHAAELVSRAIVRAVRPAAARLLGRRRST